MPTLRLLTYNVRSLRDDNAALARVIQSVEPHVVCVQEAPRFARWRSKRAALARRSGLVVASGIRDPANMLLCSLAVDVLAEHPIALGKLPGDGERFARGATLAVLRLGGCRVAVASVHLDLREGSRQRHAAELRAAIAARIDDDIPVVIAGDINDDPGSTAWQSLERQGRDAWVAAGTGDGFTSTAARPRRRIDAVFVDPRLRVVSASVPDQPDVRVASDHRPVFAEIELCAPRQCPA
ncbi:MAG: endonuclease/exonuclease/phosphatase family protein [Actinomycetia bacterium]|nr:endonuclease/exonuclease/phosphatase family protein [Actinomycetes bacterium]